MEIKAIKTRKIQVGDDLFEILNQSLKTFKNGEILAVASKIVSLSQGNVIKTEKISKEKLVRKEADLFLPKESNTFRTIITIKNNSLITSSGIDQSNAGKYFVLWPKNPQKTANDIRKYLMERFKLKHVGVIITDSKSVPLKRGAVGTCLAHSGFLALNNYVGKKDVFGRPFHVTQANIAENLAASAVAVMGEGKEQTPITIISGVNFVQFQSRNPNKKELNELEVEMHDDYFSGILKKAPWKKGGEKI